MTIPSLTPTTTGYRWMLTGCTNQRSSIQMFEVNTAPYRIGRCDDNDLSLNSDCVSSYHAELIIYGTAILLRDLKSTNGTFVNGNRVEGQLFLEAGDRIQLADTEFLLEGFACDSQEAPPATRTMKRRTSFSGHWLMSRFDELLQDGLYAAYQPIVHAADATTYGEEALARSSVEGLERPDLMFDAARQLHQEIELSQRCRQIALDMANDRVAPDQPLFMNTHPAEDLLTDVLDSLRALREKAPNRPMVIEIHEGAVTSIEQITEFAKGLASLDIELAYDDFGAGQTRLKELIEIPPDYIKFDRGLITGLHTAPEIQQHLVRTLVETSQKVGATTIAEGIEEEECADLCRDLGFDLFQGYFFGRPV